MSLGANALVTLEEAKSFLKVKDDNDVVVLEMLIDNISEYFGTATQRNLVSTVYTNQYFDGNGQEIFYFPNWPVTVLTSVYEDGVLLVENTDYYAYLDEGKLARIGARWLKGRKTLKMTFTAGYVVTGASPTLPKDLRSACLMQLGADWKKFQHNSWGETSRSIAQQSVTIIERGILDVVEKTLKNYSRYGL